jgi:transcriptional regulator with XRE-family HTH domain
VGLSTIRAAAAKVEREFFYLFARLRVEGDLPYRHPAVVAGVGMVLVLVLGGWVRVGCARLLCGHEVPPRGPCLGVCHHRRGFLRCERPNELILLTYVQGVLYTFLKINAEVQMEQIRQLRKERGLSQAKLAVMADMDPATLNRLERGTGNPNLKTLERVAEALGVEVADFFPKVPRRSSLEPSFNDVLNERRAGVTAWADYTRQIADRIRRHADDPASPAFRDPWAALFFVEEANHTAADLFRFLDWQLSAALEVADQEGMHELMAAGDELFSAIDTASGRATLMEAGRSQGELGEARRRAKEAEAERESATALLSGHSGNSA